MKRFLTLILANVLILLFLTPTVWAKGEIELLMNRGKLLYAESENMLWGAGSRFLFSGKSYCIDISGVIGKRNKSSAIEELASGYLRIELEKSLKHFVVNLNGNIYLETSRLFPFGQPEETIILEKWNKNELALGLGMKAGQYDKSYIRCIGTVGYSYYENTDDLRFVDMILQKYNSSTVIGGNIKGRLETRLKDKHKKPYGPLIWLDFWGGYNYYTGSKHNIDVTLGLGVKIVNNLGIKGSITGIKRIEVNSRDFETINYSAGIVLIF